MGYTNEKGRNSNETSEKAASRPVGEYFQQQSIHFLKKSEEKRMRMRQKKKSPIIFFKKSRKKIRFFCFHSPSSCIHNHEEGDPRESI